IYLESDQRDAGEAIALEETAKVLEELITQIDASGLAGGTPSGLLWDFQRDGLLPYEREVVDPAQKTPVDEEMVKHMESNITADVVEEATTKIVEVDEDGWEVLELPSDDDVEEEVVEMAELKPLSDDDERAKLEAELARIDASWNHRSEPSAPSDDALNDLESKLSDLDM
ncbi:MAG: hypothetical protein VXW28_03780, partial [Candidatus Thermoplasmatota archaeon]|nr:hypothetical protein [Candidatus Thermoplasmatota archaeon]